MITTNKSMEFIKVSAAALRSAGVSTEGTNVIFSDLTDKDGANTVCEDGATNSGFPLTRYCVRVWNGQYWGFVCGLDLVVCGERVLLWLGGVQVSQVLSAPSFPECYLENFRKVAFVLDELHALTKGQEWKIFPEDGEAQKAALEIAG